MLRASSCRQSLTRLSHRNRTLVVRRTFFSSTKNERKFQQHQIPNTARDHGLEYTSVVSNPQEVPGPDGIISRTKQLRKLQEVDEYDVLVIGGGATGAGAALDAANRGYKVACLERGDFASETSSRSTKLIWAGIKYMGTAVAALLSRNLVIAPVSTVKEFLGEMKMVYNCHRERRFMMEKQNHLCNWIPIVVPFDRWHVSPPPFGHPLYGFFPMLAPFVFKVYDALSWFSCPPSYILTRSKIPSVFPQLDADKLKYCAVFYEAQHNDARTNLAIAMTAAKEGADICNYVEMRDVIKDEKTGRAIGVVAVDRMTNQVLTIYAKKIIFCGGPFTDSMRKLEVSSSSDEGIKPAVRGAHGTHIVLPGYYCPSNFGLLDFNTSDKRFLFYLPWQGHTLVGTTDSKTEAETLPGPPEEEIEWIVKESSKYLKFDVRRQDVLSSWRGWRPLAVDPYAEPGAPVSRDHIISEHPTTGVIFIAGGKWTTWREMAQDVIDRAVGTEQACRTLDITLWGGGGSIDTLSVELIQKYGLSEATAEHLVKTYGIHARDVCKLSDKHKLLATNHPYIEAEVIYACREYACTIEDILSRRTRLAFLNKEAALQCILKVGIIMQKELGWSSRVTQQQIKAAEACIGSYGGPTPEENNAIQQVALDDTKSKIEVVG